MSIALTAATAAKRMNRSRLVNSNTRNNFKVYLDCKACVDATDPDTKEWLVLTKLFDHSFNWICTLRFTFRKCAFETHNTYVN